MGRRQGWGKHRCPKCKQTCPSKLTLVFHIARGFCYPEVPKDD